MSDLLHDLSGGHSNLSALCDTLWNVLCGINGIVDDAFEETDLGRLGEGVGEGEFGHVA
jgi:hypothetical protein